jgi:hypothetical protein
MYTHIYKRFCQLVYIALKFLLPAGRDINYKCQAVEDPGKYSDLRGLKYMDNFGCIRNDESITTEPFDLRREEWRKLGSTITFLSNLILKAPCLFMTAWSGVSVVNVLFQSDDVSASQTQFVSGRPELSLHFPPFDFCSSVPPVNSFTCHIRN